MKNAPTRSFDVLRYNDAQHAHNLDYLVLALQKIKEGRRAEGARFIRLFVEFEQRRMTERCALAKGIPSPHEVRQMVLAIELRSAIDRVIRARIESEAVR